jgi:hypothetical protein
VTADETDIDRAIGLYANALSEMAERLGAADMFLSWPPSWPTARAAACELRGALELLVLSGLLTHRAAIDQAENALAGANFKQARRIVKSVNRDWWPKPVVTCPDRIDDRTGDDWLTEAEWDVCYQRMSNVLHVRNPFSKEGPTLDNTLNGLQDLTLKLIKLLTAHKGSYDEEFFLLGQIQPPGTEPRVLVNRFARA